MLLAMLVGVLDPMSISTKFLYALTLAESGHLAMGYYTARRGGVIRICPMHVRAGSTSSIYQCLTCVTSYERTVLFAILRWRDETDITTPLRRGTTPNSAILVL